MSEIHKRVAGHSIVNMAGNGIRVGASFLQAVLVANWLGAEGYGQVSLIIGYTAFLHYFFLLGFDHSLPFFINSKVHSSNHHQEILKSSIKASLVFSTGSLAIISLLASFFLRGSTHENLLLPGLIIAVQMEVSALGYLYGGYFRAFKKFKEVIIREQIIFPITSLVAMFIFIKIFDWGVLGYALGFMAAALVALIYMLISLRNIPSSQQSLEVEVPPHENKYTSWQSRLSFSLPIGLMATLEPIFNYSTIIVSGWQVSAAEIGYLGVSIKLGFFVTLVLLAINPIFTPYLADLWKQDKRLEFKKLYQKVIFWCLSWSLLLTFIFAMMNRELLMLFGKDYQSASGVFIAILPGLFFEGAFGAAKLSLIMTGKNSINFYNYLFATLLNVILIYWGTLNFGIVGAAAAFSAVMILLNLVRVGQLYRSFQIPPLTMKQLSQAIPVALVLMGTWFYFQGATDTLFISKFLSTLFLFTSGALFLFWNDRELLLKRFSK